MKPPLSHQQSSHQSGFTLIELMIAVTIGLVILAALVGVLASTSGNSKSNERASELSTNGRFALDSIKKELREAGFLAYTWSPPVASTSVASVTNECLETGGAAGSFVGNVRQGVWGADNRNPFAANCIPDASYSAGNDVLVVRRLNVVPVANVPADLKAGTVYFASTFERGDLFAGTTRPGWSVVAPPLPVPAPLGFFEYKIYVYYISPFTVSADERPRIPALFRVSLDSDSVMRRELVASGIERMQVQYGHLTTVPDIRYLNAGQSPLNTSSIAADKTSWEDVNSVRIWLLARSSTVEPGLDPSAQSFDMGGASFTPPNDGFRRQLFSTTVQLRN